MQNIGHAGKDIGRGVSRVQYRFSVVDETEFKYFKIETN